MVDLATVSSWIGLLVVVNELIKHIREWRGGSPELRALTAQMKFQNDQVLVVLNSMASRLGNLAKKFGV